MISHRSLNLNAVAGNFDVSRPAISKHIKILTECGLITIRRQGREHFCEANLKPLVEVSSWVDQYREFWTARLDALEAYLEKSEPTFAKATVDKKKLKRKRK